MIESVQYNAVYGGKGQDIYRIRDYIPSMCMHANTHIHPHPLIGTFCLREGFPDPLEYSINRAFTAHANNYITGRFLKHFY